MARLPRMARMLAWQQNMKALIEAKEKAAPGASEDAILIPAEHPDNDCTQGHIEIPSDFRSF